MRRFVSILLAAALILGILPAIAPAAEAADTLTPIYNGNGYADYLAEAVLAEIPTDGMTDTEKVWAVYSWLITNCARQGSADTAYLTVDTETLTTFVEEANEKLDRGEIVLDDSGMYEAAYAASFGSDMLVYRVGNCAHFASALKLLLNHLGYPCDVIWGEFKNLDGTTYEHKWNDVQINGTWYWLDVRMDHANYLRTGTLSTQYFLITDTAAWAEEHIWDIESFPDKNTVTTQTSQNSQTSQGAAATDISVTVDGTSVVFSDASPLISAENRTLLPVSAVTQYMGCTTDWDNDTRTVRIDNEALGLTMYLRIGSTIMAVVDNTTGTLYGFRSDTAPELYWNRTYLPIRVVAEVFGYSVQWDNDTRTVIMSSGADPLSLTDVEPLTADDYDAVYALVGTF